MKSRDFCFGTCVPRIELFAQGTVASPNPVAGAEVNRLTPDAGFQLVTDCR